MKTIQMSIEENLLARVDKTAHKLNMTRSAFIHHALEKALKARIYALEERDAAGYRTLPVHEIDASEWAGEQVWGDAWNEGK